jgi:hypothetical protein
MTQPFALHYERTVARDNTVEYGNRLLQIEKTNWRFSLAGCKVNLSACRPNDKYRLWTTHCWSL